MRKIHEVLRLHFEHGRSKREIARVINASPTTVSDYLARAKVAGRKRSSKAVLKSTSFPIRSRPSGKRRLSTVLSYRS